MKYYELEPIQSREELDEAIEIIDLMLDLDLDPAEAGFLDALSDVVWQYEEIHFPMLGADECQQLRSL